jgi:hypothetical protein
MSEALAVITERHLDLPQSALFCPEELVINPSTTPEEYKKLGSGLSKLGKAQDLWVADYSLFGIRTYGKVEGLKLAVQATGFTKHHLYKIHFVAARFTTKHRYTGYKFQHYRQMMPFPSEFAYGFLERNQGKNISSNSLRALAEKECSLSKARQPRKTSLNIRAELYARLRPHSNNRKVYILVERILEDWLRTQPDVPTPVTPRIDTPVHTDNDVQPRPTYAERRKKQIADGAKPIMAKEKKLTKIKLAWTACSGEQLIDSESGPVQYKGPRGSKPTKFHSEVDAIAAEQKNFEEKGYREEVKKCPVCSGGNAKKPVWHIYHVYRS